MKLTAAMEREQEENQKQLKELTLSLRRSNEQESDVRTFIREIRQYATIQELDEGILNRLISRILVGEVKKKPGSLFSGFRDKLEVKNIFSKSLYKTYMPNKSQPSNQTLIAQFQQ